MPEKIREARVFPSTQVRLGLPESEPGDWSSLQGMGRGIKNRLVLKAMDTVPQWVCTSVSAPVCLSWRAVADRLWSNYFPAFERAVRLFLTIVWRKARGQLASVIYSSILCIGRIYISYRPFLILMERRRAASVTLCATLERFFVKTLLPVERLMGGRMPKRTHALKPRAWRKRRSLK